MAAQEAARRPLAEAGALQDHYHCGVSAAGCVITGSLPLRTVESAGRAEMG